MTLEPTAVREFTPYLRHFEIEALVPVMIGIAISLLASGLWLVVVMWHLRSGAGESIRPARHP